MDSTTDSKSIHSNCYNNNNSDDENNIDAYFNYLKHKYDINEQDINLGIEKYKNFIQKQEQQQNVCIYNRLAILIHLIMLQNGFKYLSIDDNTAKSTINLIQHKHFMQLNYNYYNQNDNYHKNREIKFDSSIKIIVNVISSVNRFTIQAFYKNYKTTDVLMLNQKQLDACFSDYASPTTSILGIIIDFKNLVLNRLKQHIYETTYLTSKSNIDTLLTNINIIYIPNELLIKITRYLDLKSALNLSITNKLFYKFILDNSFSSSCNYLWKHYLKRDFTQRQLNDVNFDAASNDYLSIYKNIFIKICKKKKLRPSFTEEYNFYFND